MGIIEQHAEAAETDFLLYTTTFCPYCVAAKRLLKQKGLTYQEINFDDDHSIRMEVVDQTRHRTVPVVIDVRGDAPIFIGGFDETQIYLR
ncbi:MAG: glutaredoxin domain-containing protein [Candidatus Poseidoniaceae archaeon]|jgi:glutaredoxin 3|nr:glutaredoxin domain-containing protein [Candidatus Poseidoniaceae archaeon]